MLSKTKRWGTMCYNQALAGHVCSQLGFPSQGKLCSIMQIIHWGNIKISNCTVHVGCNALILTLRVGASNLRSEKIY